MTWLDVRLVIEPFGDVAYRLRLPEGAGGRALLDALRALPRVVDAVVSEGHAVVIYDQPAAPEGVVDAVERALADPGGALAGGTREHVVRVGYGGPDLDDVAHRAGISQGDVIALHAGATYVVAVVGFLPGFAYLRGLDPRLVLPRRSSPRPRVAALSVGLAGPYTAVYPFASPGGWNLIGVAVGFEPFDPRRGATLELGDRVRFVAEGP